MTWAEVERTPGNVSLKCGPLNTSMSLVGVSGCLELQADLVPHFPVVATVAFLSPSPLRQQ